MNERKHWLVRPETISKLWVAGFAVLAITVIAEFFVEFHPNFSVEGIFGFNAWFGLAICVAMVVTAKALGVMLKRSDAYYGSDNRNGGDSS